MKGLRIVFFGTPQFAVPSLAALIGRGEQVVAVVTQPDRKVGRGQRVQSSSVKELAVRHGLPVLQPEKVSAAGFIEQFRELEADLAIVVAFGQIFPQALLDIPRHGFINVHSSLLPAYRGAAPINWAIINGEPESGVTIMQLDAGMDTGAILLQQPEPIGSDDTAVDLHDRLADLGGSLLGSTLDQLAADGWQPVRQDETRATYAPLLKKTDGLIDWSQPAAVICNRMRGMTPWPGCFTYIEGKLLKVHAAAVYDRPATASPGTVVSVDAQDVAVAAGKGLLMLTEVQLEGKKRMAVSDFLKGAVVTPGTVLGE